MTVWGPGVPGRGESEQKTRGRSEGPWAVEAGSRGGPTGGSQPGQECGSHFRMEGEAGDWLRNQLQFPRDKTGTPGEGVGPPAG